MYPVFEAELRKHGIESIAKDLDNNKVSYYKRYFVNGTGRTLFVRLSCGSVFKVPHNHKYTIGEFKIVTEFHFETALGMRLEPEYYNNIVSAHNYERNERTMSTITMTHVIPVSQLFDVGGVSIKGLATALYIDEAEANQRIVFGGEGHLPHKVIDVRPQTNLQLGIKIIDRANPGQCYYINVLGKVWAIRSASHEECDPDSADGVYVCGTDRTKSFAVSLKDCLPDDKGDFKPDTKVRLFTNIDAARINGSHDAIARENERKHVAEIQELKQLLEQITSRNKIIEAQLKERDLKRKDYYESRSHRRKDKSDGISTFGKIVAGITTVAVGLFGVMKFLL